ncbi:hypothetical protein H7J08_24935 [Mycobacterium frederiksbergense]|uniref:DUF6636 domain-containing protein n=1 Tax=Mycolicibacterium frederiksbergense TaxID=117567 RepID=UPI0021F37D04|nr:DUF6636 domain-containing protein [Mycolicibacterium frederiksbergense]MCV7047877.1 hypothetical protein [Mycolicibacterium frederiksbergense]
MILRVFAVAAATGAVATFCAAPAAAEDFAHFTSPSGNVSCILDSEYLRCDIAERDWALPPRPADCELDYGQGIALTPGEPATLVCAGDTTLGGPDVLAYGRSITRGALSCTSAESGMSCRDTGSGRGFSLSRQVYQLF